MRKLVYYLVGKQKSLDLISPDYEINLQDADDIRKKILSIPYVEWKRRGFSKGALHYRKKNAEGVQQFTLNKHVMTRLDQLDEGADQLLNPFNSQQRLGILNNLSGKRFS